MMPVMDEPTDRRYSYGPGGPGDDIPEHVRQELLTRRAERDEHRGRLQAIVEVRVYENGEAQPQVSFNAECVLGPDSDPKVIAQAARTARDALAGWK